jgi:hypothetical protein
MVGAITILLGGAITILLGVLAVTLAAVDRRQRDRP